MEIRKVFLSLITFWILFLTVTAFPSYSSAAIVSSDNQITFIEQTSSWSAILVVKNQKNIQEAKPDLSHQLSEYRSCNLITNHFRSGHIKKDTFKRPVSNNFSLILCNCQLLI